MSPTRSNAEAGTSDRELVIVRTLKAPRDRVWQAWSDPAQLQEWWGPRGITTESVSMDLRSGGSWRLIMRAPDGTKFTNRMDYLEVQKGSRLVYDQGADDESPRPFRVYVTFSDLPGGRTRLEIRMVCPTPEALQGIKEVVKKYDGLSTWDRLAEHVSPSDTFVITRAFDAPRDLMFRVWSEPRHLQKWLAPKGFTGEYRRADLRPGGSTHYVLSGPGGAKMWGKARYLEVARPERLVYVQSFSDENEGTTRHPMSATWPLEMKTTVELEELDRDRTQVTVTWEVYGTATPEERETFKKSRGGMNQGWGGTFEQLEGYLKEVGDRRPE